MVNSIADYIKNGDVVWWMNSNHEKVSAEVLLINEEENYADVEIFDPDPELTGDYSYATIYLRDFLSGNVKSLLHPSGKNKKQEQKCPACGKMKDVGEKCWWCGADPEAEGKDTKWQGWKNEYETSTILNLIRLVKIDKDRLEKMNVIDTLTLDGENVEFGLDFSFGEKANAWFNANKTITIFEREGHNVMGDDEKAKDKFITQVVDDANKWINQVKKLAKRKTNMKKTAGDIESLTQREHEILTEAETLLKQHHAMQYDSFVDHMRNKFNIKKGSKEESNLHALLQSDPYLNVIWDYGEDYDSSYIRYEDDPNSYYMDETKEITKLESIKYILTKLSSMATNLDKQGKMEPANLIDKTIANIVGGEMVKNNAEDIELEEPKKITDYVNVGDSVIYFHDTDKYYKGEVKNILSDLNAVEIELTLDNNKKHLAHFSTRDFEDGILEKITKTEFKEPVELDKSEFTKLTPVDFKDLYNKMEEAIKSGKAKRIFEDPTQYIRKYKLEDGKDLYIIEKQLNDRTHTDQIKQVKYYKEGSQVFEVTYHHGQKEDDPMALNTIKYFDKNKIPIIVEDWKKGKRISETKFKSRAMNVINALVKLSKNLDENGKIKTANLIDKMIKEAVEEELFAKVRVGEKYFYIPATIKECYDCKGTGKDEKGNECENCEGKGKVKAIQLSKMKPEDHMVFVRALQFAHEDEQKKGKKVAGRDKTIKKATEEEKISDESSISSGVFRSSNSKTTAEMFAYNGDIKEFFDNGFHQTFPELLHVLAETIKEKYGELYPELIDDLSK